MYGKILDFAPICVEACKTGPKTGNELKQAVSKATGRRIYAPDLLTRLRGRRKVIVTVVGITTSKTSKHKVKLYDIKFNNGVEQQDAQNAD